MSVIMGRFEKSWVIRGTSQIGFGLLKEMTRLVYKMSKACRTTDPRLFKFIRKKSNASRHEAIRYGHRYFHIS